MNIPDKIKKNVIKYISSKYLSHILLYHSCYEKIPADLNYRIHNVRPSILYEQLKWYKKHYTIVSLEEWFESKKRNGLVAVTFDDAYRSVFDEGLAVLESLDIPATVFIIGGTLEDKIFWRDKIRFIKQNGLQDDLICKLNSTYNVAFTKNNFYKESKNGKLISNKELDLFMNEYLINNNKMDRIESYCVRSINDLVNHPLISYGYHGYSHYRLSLLSDLEQKIELNRSIETIKNFNINSLINFISIPFGGYNSLNSFTLELLSDLNLDGVLLNNNFSNKPVTLAKYKQLKIAERYMVPDKFDGLEQLVISLAYKTLFK